MQLLRLAEEKLACGNALSKAIKAIGALRIDADHKVLPEGSYCGTDGNQFTELCNKLSEGLGPSQQFSLSSTVKHNLRLKKDLRLARYAPEA